MTKYRFFTIDNTAYLQFYDGNSDLWRFVPRITPAYVNGVPLALVGCPTKTQDMQDVTHYMQQENDAELASLRAFIAENASIDAYFEKLNRLRGEYLEFKIN